MNDQYDFEGLVLPADFVPEWIPIVGYSAFGLASVALLVYGVFAIVSNIHLNISSDRYKNFMYNFDEYNFRHKAYLVFLIFLSIITIFAMLITASVVESEGQDANPTIVQEWLANEYGIEVKDTEVLKILLRSGEIVEDEEASQDNKIFIKKYGTLKLIPSENNTYYLEVNGEIAIPTK